MLNRGGTLWVSPDPFCVTVTIKMSEFKPQEVCQHCSAFKCIAGNPYHTYPIGENTTHAQQAVLYKPLFYRNSYYLFKYNL